LKIGVISDTHARFYAELPEGLIKALSAVDLIIHAGDIITMDVVRGLETLAPVKGVCGNMDYPEVRVALPEKQIIDIEGKKIAIVHGRGGPATLELTVMSLFSGVDMIVFGHSHIVVNKVVNGILLFNPGSARDSYGTLETGESIEGKIHRGYY
jgi:putative phosphoesterase